MVSAFLFRGLAGRIAWVAGFIALLGVLVPLSNLMLPVRSRSLCARLHRIAVWQISHLCLASDGAGSGVGLLRHSLAGARSLLRPWRLCHGHVSDAPDRFAGRLWRIQSCRTSWSFSTGKTCRGTGMALINSGLRPSWFWPFRVSWPLSSAGLPSLTGDGRLSLHHHTSHDLCPVACLLPQ